MNVRVVFVAADASVLHAIVQLLTEDHSDIEAIGIVVLKDGLSVAGNHTATLEEVVSGTSAVFIGERMPIASVQCLALLREAGLPETAAIVGTSREEQPYATHKALITSIVARPEILRALLNM